MKTKITLCVGMFFVVFGCGLFNSDFRYQPKNSDEYYFPPISSEFKEKQEECIRLENYPCNFAEANDTLNDFANRWYSKHLKSLKEPILYKQVGEGKKIVRFTHLGTWTKPYSYRIENQNGEIIGIYNKTKGLGGYDADRRIQHEQKELTTQDWDFIITTIEKNEFWIIPTHDPNMILDGEEWILEVLIGDKYHVVSRNSPNVYDGQKYAEICENILEAYRE